MSVFAFVCVGMGVCVGVCVCECVCVCVCVWLCECVCANVFHELRLTECIHMQGDSHAKVHR